MQERRKFRKLLEHSGLSHRGQGLFLETIHTKNPLKRIEPRFDGSYHWFHVQIVVVLKKVEHRRPFFGVTIWQGISIVEN